MSEYKFCVSHLKPTRNAAKKMSIIAKKHGARLVEMTIPGTGYQRWFTGPNLGHPFDHLMHWNVTQDLIKAGILIDTDEGLLLADSHTGT